MHAATLGLLWALRASVDRMRTKHDSPGTWHELCTLCGALIESRAEDASGAPDGEGLCPERLLQCEARSMLVSATLSAQAV